MKVATITCICSSLMGCAMSAGDGGGQAPQTQEGTESAYTTSAGAALTVGKFSDTKNAKTAAAAVRLDPESVPAFSSLANEEPGEVVGVRAKFDPARVNQLEAFRAQVGGVQR